MSSLADIGHMALARIINKLTKTSDTPTFEKRTPGQILMNTARYVYYGRHTIPFFFDRPEEHERLFYVPYCLHTGTLPFV